jgi:hypothetical protein
MSQRNIQPVSMALFFMAFFVVIFAFSYTFMSSPRHDYTGYMKQWSSIIQGQNPWADQSNAYGPVHTALALLYSVHFNVPRLFFVLLWIIGSFGIAIIINKNPYLPDTYKYALYLALFLNPLFWIFVVSYGTNDILMAFFVLLSILFFKAKRDIPAGFVMAVSIAVKFMPIVMLPFLIFSKVNIRWRFAISVAISSVFIFGVSYCLWGNDLFHPLQMGYDRQSKMLSIFSFLRGRASPLRLFTDNPNLDWLSVYLCVASVFAFFFIHIKYGFEGILSSIIAMVILLTLYKVGHHQFYITLVMLIILWISLDYKKIMDTGFELTSVFTFIIWLSFVSFLYMLTWGYSETGWREILGLPTFILSGWMLIDLIRYSLNVAAN